MKYLILHLFLYSAFLSCVFAGPFTFKENSYNLKMGMGLRIKTNIRPDNRSKYLKDDPILNPFPFIRLKFSRVEIEPDKLRLVFARNSWWELNARVNYLGHDYNTPTIGHRHKSLFAGFSLRILLFKLKFLKDVGGKSSGSVARLSAYLPLYFSDETKLLLQSGYEYWDHKYINYYFGVKENEVTIDRPYYKGKDERSVFGKAIFMKHLSQHFITRITLKFRRWSGHLIDSPTVKTTKIYDGLMGIVYEF